MKVMFRNASAVDDTAIIKILIFKIMGHFEVTNSSIISFNHVILAVSYHLLKQLNIRIVTIVLTLNALGRWLLKRNTSNHPLAGTVMDVFQRFTRSQHPELLER